MIDTRGRLTGAALVLGITCVFLFPGIWAAGEQAARVASIQNQVESRADGAADWKTATLNQALHERERIRTCPGSRAAILYSDQTLQRINEKSEVEILPPTAGNPGVLKVLSGTHYFSSRKPKDYSRTRYPLTCLRTRSSSSGGRERPLPRHGQRP